jgi:hypothetical protein
VVEAAVRRRLPATYESKEFVKIGGLMSYGPSFPDMTAEQQPPSMLLRADEVIQ